MMALDGTYNGLKASVADWLNRQDLTAAVPDFITLGEGRMNRRLRVVQMETMDSGTTADAIIAVPADWLETRTLRLANPNAGQQILEYVGEEEWDQLQASGLHWTTRYYTIINGAFQVLPAPSANVDYILRYYARIPALSAANPTNWLLTKSPDAYLYNSLLGAEAYLKNDDRLPVWKGISDEIFEDMRIESDRAKRSTTRLRTVRSTYG
jgi:hypothetical protein